MLIRELKAHLKTLAPFLGTATVPICNCVHFDERYMWATDLEASAQVECPVGVTVSIPHKHLGAALQTLPAAEEIRMSQVGSDLVVEGASGKTRLAGSAVDDRPALAAAGELVATAKTGDDLKDAFSAVAVAASTDESRRILTGVFLEARANELALTATDSYRLHHNDLEASVEGEASAVISPRYLKVLPGGDPAVVEFFEEWVRFEQGAVTVTVRSIDGEFPNYRQLRPSTTVATARLARDDGLDKTLRTFERLGQRLSSSTPVVCEFRPDASAVSARLRLVDVGEHEASIALDSYDGPELDIAFNPGLFRDAIAFGGTVVEMIDALKPAVITGSSMNRYALLMPVRLS